MAESVLMSLSSKVLSTIASPAFRMAYEKGVSIWETRDELTKLTVKIETIQAVLADAEKKQEDSDSVKNWIRSIKAVLYDADDLLDEVAIENLPKQQIMDGKNTLSLKNKVWVSCSKLNPVVSRNSFAKKVKAIRERLVEISIDMAQFNFLQGHPKDQFKFVQGHPKDPTISTRYLKNEKTIIGRDEDKKAILKMLIGDAGGFIAVYGVGGIGKSTLAHLIYNDEKVVKIFKNRWFACISNISDEKDFLGTIYQSISGEGYSDLSVIQLEDKIQRSVAGKKFLLILDDVWDDHRGRWKNRKSLFSGGAKGSKIFVTARMQSVGEAMGAIGDYSLNGLSENDSWGLFKSLAFDSPYENDPRMEILGKKLLKRCWGIPLAILFLGSLLHKKNIQEWEEIEREGFQTLRGKYRDETMSILKLSYSYLPSKLKQCFTYCCLFPKDYRYNKDVLIYHWIAQGYINLDEGEFSFMHLLRMGFFQDIQEDYFGEIVSCKMHDIVHDLALFLGGEESITLSNISLNVSSCTRHVSLMVDGEEGELWDIPTPLLSLKSLRSCLLSRSSPVSSQLNLNQLCSSFKVLRTLTLSGLGIEYIPPSIGELKLVKYLDLSFNNFEKLPDSITDLVNLLILNLESCTKLKEWPPNFKKLVNLMSLNFKHCDELNLMPEGIGEMPGLQYLSDFIVGKDSELDVLNGLLNQLKCDLSIRFCGGLDVEDERTLEIPAVVSLKHLDMSFYPGQSIRCCGINECSSELVHLQLSSCENIKHLPPSSCFPNLRWLHLLDLSELETLQEEELSNGSSQRPFFPCLEELILNNMPKLSRLQGKAATEATTSASSVLEFSRLSKLRIVDCPNLELNSFPTCRSLRELHLQNVGNNTPWPIQHEMLSNSQSLEKIAIYNCKQLSYIHGEALASLEKVDIRFCCSLESLYLVSPCLLDVKIMECDELTSIEVIQSPHPSLQFLRIKRCRLLQSLQIDTCLSASLEVMKIADCPELMFSNAQDKSPLVEQGVPEAETRRLVFKNTGSAFIERSLSSLSMSSLKEIIISGCKGPLSLPGAELVSLQKCQIEEAEGLGSLHIPSPHLQHASFKNCVGLTSVEVEAPSRMDIIYCRDLKNLQIARPNALKEVRICCHLQLNWCSISNLCDCTCIRKMELAGVEGVFLERFLSSPSPSLQEGEIDSLTVTLASLEELYIGDVHGLKHLSFKSQNLNKIHINNCKELTSVELESPCSYWDSSVTIHHCSQLKNVQIPKPIALRRLVFSHCPELRLSTSVVWDSITNLNSLQLDPLPSLKELQLQLPQFLLERGLQIEHAPVFFREY